MRNWNRRPMNEANKAQGFYSTYEELKPHILKYIYGFPYCFYSTYEELKPRKLTVMHDEAEFLQYLWGIETSSYILANDNNKCFTVPMRIETDFWYFVQDKLLSFTVPMRNWNNFACPQVWTLYNVLQYLWELKPVFIFIIIDYIF